MQCPECHLENVKETKRTGGGKGIPPEFTGPPLIIYYECLDCGHQWVEEH